MSSVTIFASSGLSGFLPFGNHALKLLANSFELQLPGVLSPNARDARDGIPFFPPSDAGQNNMDDEIEGFLCPICMGTFTSPELLSGHFEEAHNQVWLIFLLRITLIRDGFQFSNRFAGGSLNSES